MLKLLVVDDDQGMLKTLSYILKDIGYDVVSRSLVTEAVEIIKEQTFDIIMSDIRMPGMNGVELIKKVKQTSPGTPVVMITAYTMHELVEEAKREGALAVFSKPLDINKMIAFFEDFKNKSNEQALEDDPVHISLNRMLEEKDKIIERLKAELAEIKKDPGKQLETQEKKVRSEQINTFLNPKEMAMFNLLSTEEKTYDELLDEMKKINLGIRDISALRLQVSRLTKKLEEKTVFRLNRFRRAKTLFLKVSRESELHS